MDEFFDFDGWHSSSRPFVFDFDDGHRKGRMLFYYRPLALTRETYPAFVRLGNEHLARAQRNAVARLIERAETQVALEHGFPSAKEPQGDAYTTEQIEAEIEARNGAEIKDYEQRLEVAAKRLMILLDPKKGHNIVRGGELMPTTWQALAECFPPETLETITESIAEKMTDPFGLRASLKGSNTTHDEVPASSDV